jgi:hypothetical protein
VSNMPHIGKEVGLFWLASSPSSRNMGSLHWSWRGKRYELNKVEPRWTTTVPIIFWKLEIFLIGDQNRQKSEIATRFIPRIETQRIDHNRIIPTLSGDYPRKDPTLTSNVSTKIVQFLSRRIRLQWISILTSHPFLRWFAISESHWSILWTAALKRFVIAQNYPVSSTGW